MAVATTSRSLIDVINDVEDVLAYCARHSTPVDECREYINEVIKDVDGARFVVASSGDSYVARVLRGDLLVTIVCNRRGSCYKVYG